MKTGVYLLENPKALQTIHKENPGCIEEILVHENSVDKWDFQGNIRVLTNSQFNSISTNKSPQGVIGVITIPANCYSATLPKICDQKVLLLENIQDPGNIGTLIRTAAAFNFSGILLSKECADPFSPKATQASAGSMSAVWIRITDKFQKFAMDLKNNGFSIIAADIRGNTEPVITNKKKVILALGNEGKGLSQETLALADTTYKIPFNNSSVESLNVAVAGSICMYLISNK